MEPTRPMKPFRSILAAAVVVTAVGGLGIATEKPQCAVPQLTTPAFSSQSKNRILWSHPSNNPTEGDGFIIQVARQPVFKPSGGGFADFVDGTPNLVHASLSATRGERFKDITLPQGEERTFWYQIRVDASPNSACTLIANPWSTHKATTQDHRAPDVTVETAPMTVFLAGQVTLTGTAQDRPGELVAESSGASHVRVRIDYTTPLGAFYPAIRAQDFAIAPAGTWSATYENMPPGTYRAVITGFDMVGNGSSEPVERSFVVVNAP